MPQGEIEAPGCCSVGSKLKAVMKGAIPAMAANPHQYAGCTRPRMSIDQLVPAGTGTEAASWECV